jgi:integrative and conjugative element protein (TIGR02256 family)
VSYLRDNEPMITYPIGMSGQNLIFLNGVLVHFQRYRQVRWWQREAGGQLFARVEVGQINVVEATGPRRSDRRSRTSYEPDRIAEQQEINERFPLGLHFIGDWHTHPEEGPQPSSIDVRSTADDVRKSHHCLNAFVLVIVGRGELPGGLHVSLHDGTMQYPLKLATLGN